MRLLTLAAVVLAVSLPAAAEEPAVADLIGRLSDEDPEVRVAAREALRDAGERARPELEKLARAAEGPRSRAAAALLRQIGFDARIAASLAGGDAWFRWERAGKAKAWVRLRARPREGGERGYSLTETLFMDDVTLTTKAETDRDLVVASVKTTLKAAGDRTETSAVFADGVCTFEEDGKKHELPAPGTPYTDWSLVRFAPALLANPPDAPEAVVWDSTDAEPATTNLRFGSEPVVTDAPGGGSVRATAVKVEGLLVAWVTEDGRLSHATHGEGSTVVPVKAEDVPEKLRK